jgi:hypothetical protein
MPGDILDYPVPGGNKYRNLALQVGKVSSLREYNMIMNPVGLRPKKDCTGKAQQQLSKDPKGGGGGGGGTVELVVGPRWVPDTKTDWSTDHGS